MKKSTQATSCTMFSVTHNDALQSKPAKYAQLCSTPDDNMYYIRAIPDRKTLISTYHDTKNTQGEIFTRCESWGQESGKSQGEFCLHLKRPRVVRKNQ